MNDIVERIEGRIHDAPMPTEHLLDECAEEIKRLRAALENAIAHAKVWKDIAS